jgi:hypothetical protein
MGVGEQRKYMGMQEFVDVGFLQEANRKFFHPLGLALSVDVDDDGAVTSFGRIWDSRDDPEGIAYGDGMLSMEKAVNVSMEASRHVESRVRLLGWVVQRIRETDAES